MIIPDKDNVYCRYKLRFIYICKWVNLVSQQFVMGQMAHLV